MPWPVVRVSDKDLRVCNPESNVAVCINRGLSLEGGEDAQAISKFSAKLGALVEKVNCIGVLTVIDRGAQILIANVAANPRIDTLVLCGFETIFRPSLALKLVKEKGVSGGDKEISGYSEIVPMGRKNRPFLKPLPSDAIEEFRQRVKVVYLPFNGREEESYLLELKRIVEENYSQKKIGEGVSLEFDFSALRPETMQLPEGNSRSKETKTAFKIFKTRVGIAAIAPRELGSQEFLGDSQDFVIHEVNAWACAGNEKEGSLGISEKIGDEEWFSLGIELARKAREKGFSEVVLKNPIKCKLRALALDSRGFFEITSDAVSKEVKALYIPQEGKRFEVLAKAGQSPWDFFDLIEDKALLASYAEYPHRGGHLAYLGAEFEKALFACANSLHYSQDRELDERRRINTERICGPSSVSSDSIEGLWKKMLERLWENGLRSENEKKGKVIEGWCAFWQTRLDGVKIPVDFGLFNEETAELYAKSLFAKNDSGEKYTYGDRQRFHFGYDQLERAVEKLKENPGRGVACQRYYPPEDLVTKGRPCLIGETYFVSGGKLNVVHFARAHDLVKAFPQNLFGVSAWARFVAEKTNLQQGDLTGLSINYNIRSEDNGIAEALGRQAGKFSDKKDERELKPVFINGKPEQAINEIIELTQGARVVGILFDKPRELDFLAEKIPENLPAIERMRKSRAETKPISGNEINQIRVCADNVKRKPFDNTNLVSPRDPILDKEKEISNLLFFEPRVHLGKLHSAAIFFNTIVGEGEKLEASYDSHNLESIGLSWGLSQKLHSQISELSGFPQGPLFVFHAPLIRE